MYPSILNQSNKNIIIFHLLLVSLVGYFTMSLNFRIQEISARYHKSPSGDCEVTDTKGLILKECQDVLTVIIGVQMVIVKK